MPKTTTPKKVVKTKKVLTKVAEKKPVEKQEEYFVYHVVATLNDKTYECDTNDLRSAILALKPEFLRTRLILKITKDGKTVERMYYLQQAKMLFINKYAMDSLLKYLIF